MFNLYLWETMGGIGVNKKHIVRLSQSDQVYIQQKINDKKVSAGIRKRCMVLLLADESAGTIPTQSEIATRCKVSEVTVFQTIKDYCTEGIEHTLQYRKRADSPRKRIVSGEIEAHLIALACSAPPKGFSKWTLRLLTKHAIELDFVHSIGRETIRKTLKKHNLSLT